MRQACQWEGNGLLEELHSKTVLEPADVPPHCVFLEAKGRGSPLKAAELSDSPKHLSRERKGDRGMEQVLSENILEHGASLQDLNVDEAEVKAAAAASALC